MPDDQSPDRAAETSDPLTEAVVDRDSDIIAMVRQALDNEDAMLAFQPVMPARDPSRPAFYEGLIRILDTRGRIIPAKDFILEVEPTELGRRIDVLSLRLGLRALRDWPQLRLSINLSARSIDHPAWMAELDRTLAEDPTLGDRLILEITESSAINMPRRVSAFIARLQDRGIGFALDDFGSGYTSMRYLADFCFDVLKMDGHFCRGIARNADNRALVKAIVGIGTHFDMLIIAEMVETAEDAETLAALGVDCLQGYYFGAPTIRPRWAPCTAEAGYG